MHIFFPLLLYCCFLFSQSFRAQAAATEDIVDVAEDSDSDDSAEEDPTATAPGDSTQPGLQSPGAAATEAGSSESGGRDLSVSSEGAAAAELQRSDSARRPRVADTLRASKQAAAQGRRAARRKARE